MTDLELLEIDPMTLQGDMLNKWEHAQKKAMRINRVYKDQLEEKVKQSELEARDFMSKRDIKVANLQNMEATIRMEALYNDYTEALELASARVQSVSEQFEPGPKLVSQDVPEVNS